MDAEFTIALLRLALFLPLVLGLAYLATRYLARVRGWRPGAAGQLAVVERLPLGPKTALYVVRVGRRYYLLAGAEGGVTLLREQEDYGAAEEAGRTLLPRRERAAWRDYWRFRRPRGEEGAGKRP